MIVSGNQTVDSSLQMFQSGENWVLNTQHQSSNGHVNYVKLSKGDFLERCFKYIYTRKIQSVLVEGGSQLLQSLIDHGLWDECYTLVAENNWERGIPAPRLNLKATDEFKVGRDTIRHYRKP